MTAGLWVFLSVTAVLLLFAVLSNSLVIFCVYRYRKLRSVTNVMICNLAVSDILLAGFVMPQRLHDITHEEHFHEGPFLCKIVNFTPIFIITSSVYTLVCISFERRRAIADTRRDQMTYSTLCKIIPALWIFGATVSVPTLFEYDVTVVTLEPDNSTINKTHILTCGSQMMPSIYSVSNAIFIALISYIIPVILMLKNYLHVALFVWDTGKSMTMATGSDTAVFRLVKSRMKLVKLLIAVAVIFTLSWLPFFVMLLYAKITGKYASNDAGGFVNLLLIALATFSTAYNVVLYVVYNPSFSCAIKGLFRIKQYRQGGLDRESSARRYASEIRNNCSSRDDLDQYINNDRF